MSAQVLSVACAVLFDADGRLLCAQRGNGMDNPGLWEFPGGKVEPGESPAECIVREMLEETGMQLTAVEVGPEFHSAHASGRTLALIPVLCSWVSGAPQAREHKALRWCAQAEWMDLDWVAADLPVLDWVMRGMPGE